MEQTALRYRQAEAGTQLLCGIDGAAIAVNGVPVVRRNQIELVVQHVVVDLGMRVRTHRIVTLDLNIHLPAAANQICLRPQAVIQAFVMSLHADQPADNWVAAVVLLENADRAADLLLPLEELLGRHGLADLFRHD